MSDTPVISPVPVIALPPVNPPQTFNPKDVVEAAQGIVKEKDKGFIPSTDFHPEKPYEDWTQYLKERQAQIDKSPLSPEQIINDFKAAKTHLVERHETDLTALREALEKYYESRLTVLTDYNDNSLSWRDQLNGELRSRAAAFESEKKVLEERLITELADYYDKRIQELERFHREFKSELGVQLTDAKDREHALKDKVADLEQERTRWLDERRDWLDKRETAFGEEKREERDSVQKINRQILDSDHPDFSNKNAWQILAARLNQWALFVTIIIVALIAALAVYFTWGNKSAPSPSDTTPPAKDAGATGAPGHNEKK